ncbi:MAG TPA: hypothetical protein VG123_22745, partial [Streptosporangiaceae bacterium]|nr:hypothetical protein [Streptosporangiaceae bacterium]
AFEGSRPAFLDRIPGWERTRLAATVSGSAHRVGVRLDGGARLGLDRLLATPLREPTGDDARSRRHRKLGRAEESRQADRQAGTWCGSKSPGQRDIRDRNRKHVVIHQGHLPSSWRRQLALDM